MEGEEGEEGEEDEEDEDEEGEEGEEGEEEEEDVEVEKKTEDFDYREEDDQHIVDNAKALETL